MAAALRHPNSLPPPLYDSKWKTGLAGMGPAIRQARVPNFVIR